MLKHYSNLCKFSYKTQKPDIKWGKSNIAVLRRNILCIRGTNTLWDIISDANIIKTDSSCKQIKFHSGFYKSAKQLADIVHMNKLFKKNINYDICGHSAGGAIGIIAAYELMLLGYDINKVVSFGSPKVTDTNGCQKLGRIIDYTRIICEDDVFAEAPPDIFGNKFEHFGNTIKLESEYNSLLQIHSMQNYGDLLNRVCDIQNCDYLCSPKALDKTLSEI